MSGKRHSGIEYLIHSLKAILIRIILVTLQLSARILVTDYKNILLTHLSKINIGILPLTICIDKEWHGISVQFCNYTTTALNNLYVSLLRD